MTATADILFLGNIVTMEPARPTARALAVRDGRIVALGTEAELAPLSGPTTRRVELGSRTLLPGFVEAHAHPYSFGRVFGDPLVNIRASHIPSYEAVVATIRRRATKAAVGEVLAFVGLDALRHVGMREPTLAELDEWAPRNPLAIYTFNFHSLFVNSPMLQRLGLDDTTPDFPGGRYERDAQGRLSGKMVEFAAFKGFEAVCSMLGSDRGYQQLSESMQKFARSGITTSTDIGMHEGALSGYRRMFERGPLPLRLRLFARSALDAPMTPALDWGGDMVRMIGIKAWADGSPFVGTAWLSRPYLNNDITLKGIGLGRDDSGHMNFEPERLTALIDRYASQGVHVATHAQGDRTIDATLDAYEACITRYGRPALPHRLEHCGTMREDQIERALSLGVVCSFFLAHVYHWGDPIRDALLGPERGSNYMPIGWATRAGMRLSYHSDAPMTEPDPLRSIQIAVTRGTASGAVLGEHQRVSIDQALKAVTIDAAYQLGMEHEAGSLGVGKFADFVILGDDPRQVPPQSLASIAVQGTWVAGREVWSAES
jgi:predicted amidohydrolase YtcJ